MHELATALRVIQMRVEQRLPSQFPVVERMMIDDRIITVRFRFGASYAGLNDVTFRLHPSVEAEWIDDPLVTLRRHTETDGHGYTPPGYASCTREAGHSGPCAHPLA